MDSKLSVVVLKTFVSSGKTSSLAAYLLSKLRMGQSAVFMTPSLHEVVSFILGIRTEIEDYVNSDDVKVKNSFNRMILELHEKLKHLDVFEHPPVFGQKVDEKKSLRIYVLPRTDANVIYLLGTNTHEFVCLDDINGCDDLARRLVLSKTETTIIISGADVPDMKPSDFPVGTPLNVLNVQKPIDAPTILREAEEVQEGFFEIF